MTAKLQIDQLRERITDEIFLGLGLKRDSFIRRTFGWLVYPPTNRFAGIFARADEAIGVGGMPSGCKSVVQDFGIQVNARGIENIPAEGPLLIVSNHPGAYDLVCLGSFIPRKDLKILVWETPFYHAMENANKWFVYANSEIGDRMVALREAVQHLQNGGALLQFGSGTIEPDPSIVPHTESTLKEWSSSLEIMLRKAEETRLVLAVASGVLLKKFAGNPLTFLRRRPIDRRRIAEITQIIQQLLWPQTVQIMADLSFAPPVTVDELAEESGGRRLMPAVLERAQALLADHRQAYDITV